MEMEELKSIPFDVDYVDLHREFTYEERGSYYPATFDEKDLMPCETLYNVFDGECVTHEIDGDDNAMGFIAGIPTHAVAEYNKVRITMCNTLGSARLFYKWKNAVMENFFGFEDLDSPELNTTIYDKQNDMFVWCYQICFDTIVLEHYHNQKYGEK